MRKFLGFVAAGAVATSANYLVFLLLVGSGVNVIFSAAFGYMLGISISYFINLRAVFKESTRSSFIRYASIYCVGMLVQLSLLTWLLSLAIDPRLANALAIASALMFNFSLIRKFAFIP